MKTPKWDGSRWRIREMREGKMHSFSSSVPGVKGRKEVIKKYEQWYYGDASGEKTVAQVTKEYLADVKVRCGEFSPALEQYECYSRLYIVPACGQKKICKMTLRDWQSVINEARGQRKPLSEKTLRNLRALIMSIIKFGYEDYQCEMPRGELYIPKGHSKKEKEILQKDDIRRLLEPSKLFYHPLFTFLLVTGMRPSEALGLKVSNLHGDTVSIERGINARGHITDLKNANAKRVIPIGELAAGILRKTIQRNEDLNLHTDWIFCSPDGSQGKQNGMRKHWAKLKAERDLPGTVYSLRHTFISMMKNVMPEQMIKDIVGHSVSFDSFSTYGHILDSEHIEAAQIIDLTFGQNPGQNKSTKNRQKDSSIAECP